MQQDFTKLALEHQAALTGYLRAHLVDHGIAEEVIARRGIGWDGEHITVPVWRGSSLSFFERWALDAIGVPVDEVGFAARYPSDRFNEEHETLVFAEGIHDCLIFESMGIPAIAASGRGLVFKTRDWTQLFKGIPEVLIAVRCGEKRSRRKYVLSRDELVTKMLVALPQARRIEWPTSIGRDEGAFEFFVRDGRSAEDFLAL